MSCLNDRNKYHFTQHALAIGEGNFVNKYVFVQFLLIFTSIEIDNKIIIIDKLTYRYHLRAT